MANPFAKSKTFHRIGNFTATPIWKVLPTPSGLALVTTTGRSTGKLRARAMRVVRAGNRAYAASILGPRSDWLRNARGHPDVTVKLGGKTYRATARVITDPEEQARAAAAYRPVAGWYDYFDYLSFVWGIPTKGKLLRVHDEWLTRGVPVVFELRPGG